MKIVLDMNLSPSWVSYLQHAGHEAIHWSEIGDATAPDNEIMEWARKRAFVVFTHDLDFSRLLWLTNATSPSVIQLRIEDVRPISIGKIVLAALNEIEDELKTGALVTIDPRHNRLRLLPLKGK